MEDENLPSTDEVIAYLKQARNDGEGLTMRERKHIDESLIALKHRKHVREAPPA